MNKAKHWITWLVMSGLWNFAAISGYIYHNIVGQCIFQFYTWWLVLGWSFVSFLKIITIILKMDNPFPARIIPAWVTVTEDLFITTLCAETGHWFYAALVALQMVGEQFIFDSTTERNKSND